MHAARFSGNLPRQPLLSAGMRTAGTTPPQPAPPTGNGRAARRAAGGGSATLARACIYPTMAMLLLCIIHAFKRRTTPARNRTPPPHLGSLVLVEHVSRTSGKVAAVDASSPLRNACLLRRRCEDMDRDGGPWIWHRSRRCLWVLAVLHDVHPDTRTLSETIPHILK